MSARRVRGRLVRLGALLAAAGLTVGLARSTTSAAFTAATTDGGNSVTASGNFCAAPGSTSTVTSVGDSWTDEAATTTTHGGDTGLRVRSSSAGDRRTWVRFTLPAPPSHCTVTTAVLSLYARSPVGGRTIDVYRGQYTTPEWTSSGITWATQPASAGARVGTASRTTIGWQTWTVTAHVQDQYANGNNGFVLQDRNENAGSAVEQVYDDLQTPGSAPTLVVTWG
jgi:hypothetical protein